MYDKIITWLFLFFTLIKLFALLMANNGKSSADFVRKSPLCSIQWKSSVWSDLCCVRLIYDFRYAIQYSMGPITHTISISLVLSSVAQFHSFFIKTHALWYCSNQALDSCYCHHSIICNWFSLRPKNHGIMSTYRLSVGPNVINTLTLHIHTQSHNALWAGSHDTQNTQITGCFDLLTFCGIDKIVFGVCFILKQKKEFRSQIGFGRAHHLVLLCTQ